jgi:hypothetical protein
MENNQLISLEQQFGEVIDIILQHKSNASRVVNEELLLSAWHVGGYVSAKLKSEEWGSKVVTQLSEYIRSKRPDIKGYSRSSIYNMVMFYDEYSSDAFNITLKKYITTEFLQTLSGQIQINETQKNCTTLPIVQTLSGQNLFISFYCAYLLKML